MVKPSDSQLAADEEFRAETFCIHCFCYVNAPSSDFLNILLHNIII